MPPFLSEEKAKEKIKWMDEHHLEERAKRLIELGPGGLEAPFTPHRVEKSETTEEYKEMAEEFAIPHLYNQAAVCYVYGRFHACVALFAALTEGILKLELKRRAGIDAEKLRLGLGTMIGLCESRKLGILSPEAAETTRMINKRRNELMHFNLAKKNPKGALQGNPEDDEIVPFFPEWGGKAYSVYKYKRAAKEALDNTYKLLTFLYKK